MTQFKTTRNIIYYIANFVRWSIYMTFAVLLAFILVLMITGCTEPKDDPTLIGAWSSDEARLAERKLTRKKQ
jgi:hypothetical protein